MNCKEIRELLPDVAAGMGAGTPEVEKHIPEPSPYFDTRLQARLREEMARASAGWLHWLRRPAGAMALAAVLVAGAVVVGYRSYSPAEAINTKPPELSVPVLPGTAVGDLQALERNNDLYADFDMLDELQVQDDVTANP